MSRNPAEELFCHLYFKSDSVDVFLVYQPFFVLLRSKSIHHLLCLLVTVTLLYESQTRASLKVVGGGVSLCALHYLSLTF